MTTARISNFSTQLELTAAPIDPDWILEGTPLARNRVLSSSSDRVAWTMLWDCTAGKFNWHYSVDETVHVIEGSVTIRDDHGMMRTLVPGDIAFFPAGCSATWHVENYVRKVAFCQRTLPAFLHLPLRLIRRLRGGGVARLLRTSLADTAPVADASQDTAQEPARFKRSRA